MPKRRATEDDSEFELGSGGELSGDDEEWREEDNGYDGDDADDAAEVEDEVWDQRRQRKPISPVRTRATRKDTKRTKPAAPEYAGQWIKKRTSQTGAAPQIKLFDYLSGGSRKKSSNSLMERFGYKGPRNTTKPLPEDEDFIDDGPVLDDEEPSFVVDDEEEIEIEFSDDEDEIPKKKKLRKGVERGALHSGGKTTTIDISDDADEDLQRALKKSRMEHLRDRARKQSDARQLRKVMRQAVRESAKYGVADGEARSIARSQKQERDEEVAAEEEEEEEEEEEDEDVAAVNNLLVKCEEKSTILLKLLQKMKNVQGEAGGDDKSGNSDIRVLKQPPTLQKNLKSYQIAGLNWLHLLYRQKLNGILADEMGLGKTVQTISLLAQLQLEGNTGPHMVIVPASTLHNWKKELAAWCPDLSVLIYYGNLQERSEIRSQLKTLPSDHYNVWVTTYTVAQSKHDRSFFKKRNFKYLILDEAQNIKNTSSQRYKSLFGLSSENKLLLTGTPVENTLNELVALLYFLMPRMFGSVRDYEELKSHLARAQKRSDLLESGFIGRMKQVIAPFLLRRLKSEVSIELDPKKERVCRCPMSELQAQLYDELLSLSKKTMAENAAAIESEKESKTIDVLDVMDDEDPLPKGTPKKALQPRSPRKLSQGNLMNICMQLIKMADHPLLLRSYYSDDKIAHIARILKKHYPREFDGTLDEVIEDLQVNSDFVIHQVVIAHAKVPATYHLDLDNLWEASGKMDYLRTLLPELFAQDRRVLIFSLMTRMLDILEVFLEKIGYRFLRLDGTTPVEERQELIDQFNTDRSIPIFLLSTKAGGLGINLTSADTVIFYDSSFNPQVDRQAEDRVHRLGQEKQVEIIRLLSENTIDEHIFRMAQQKKKLSEALLAEGSFVNKDKAEMDVKDILKMISSSVHAPSPVASQGRSLSRGAAEREARGTGAARKVVLSGDSEDEHDSTAAAKGKSKTEQHQQRASAERGAQTNGRSHGKAIKPGQRSAPSDASCPMDLRSVRKRKRAVVENEEEEEEEDREERSRGGRQKGRGGATTTICLASEDEEPSQEVEQAEEEDEEEEEPKSEGDEAIARRKRKGRALGTAKKPPKPLTATSTTTNKRARIVQEDKENAAPHPSPSVPSSTATTNKRQLTLEEFKRKYAAAKPK